MPSRSASQHRLMAAVAHNPFFAKKAGIPQSVGRDFTEADKGRKFAKGGDMKNAAMKKIFAGKETPAEERKEKAAVKKAGMSYKAAEKKFEGEKYAKGGFTSCADGVATKGKTKAQKFAGGGFAEMMDLGSHDAFADAKPMVARAGPNRMVAPSMTPAGGAGLSQLIKDLGGGRLATPEEIAKMNSTLSRLGMSRPQFNPADAGKLRAEMQSRMAAQGMKPSVGATPSPKQSVLPARPPTYGRPGSRSENFDPVTGQIRPESSSPRPTNPFTNPKQYAMEQQMQQAFSTTPKPTTGKQQLNSLMAEKMKAKPGGPVMRGGQQVPEFSGGPKGPTPMPVYGLPELSPEQIKAGEAEQARKAQSSSGAPQMTREQMMRMAGIQTPASSARPASGSVGMKKGGSVKTFAKGGSIDGCATKGKTKGRYI